MPRGPVDIGADFNGGSTGRWFYDYRDLTEFFTKGKNEIAVEVFHRWPIDWTVSRGHPGLIFEAEVSLHDGSKQMVATDPSWKAAPADWITAENGLTFYAGLEPPGWRIAGFDDSKWNACEVTKDLWSPLIPSEIPPLMEARYPILRIENVRGGVKVPNDAAKNGRGITVTGDGSFTVVFDRVLSAYPTLKLKGGKAARVTIRAHRQSQMVLGGGEQCYEWPFMDEIAPAFTVSFSGVTEPVEVEDVGANFTSQPVDYVGSFECSDEKLNKIWKASRWAVQICMQTHHLDSPNHQEPIADPGDYVIEAMVSYYAFGQPWLARQDIRKFAWLLKSEKYRNFHTSYAFYWLDMLSAYGRYSGDESLSKEMAPYVFALIDSRAAWVGFEGLVTEAPNYMFMDWVNIGGFNCHHPPAVIGQGYLTALYAGGLMSAFTYSAWYAEDSRTEKYIALGEECKEAFNRELWVETKGLYRDGKPFLTSVEPGRWLPADRDIETFSPHVNVLAVLCGLTPREKQKAIMEKVMSRQPLNTQPWFMHWVFAALDHVNLFDKYGTQQLRRWEVVPETQSFREMWHGGDLSHGWCSTPLVQMSSRILGVTLGHHEYGVEKKSSPAKGAKRSTIWHNVIDIHPRFCDLAWAKGTVPTSLGLVAVSLNAERGRRTVDVELPNGVEGQVFLPSTGLSNPVAILDGTVQKPVHYPRYPTDFVVSTPPGWHHLELRDGKAHREK